MYEKALVAVDGSKPSLKAVETARELAKKSCLKEITLIYVINVPHAGVLANGLSVDFVPEAFQKELIKTAREVMEKSKEIIGPEIQVKTVIEEGPPAETILHLIEKEHYDVIVVGNRGLNPLQRLFWGSVSNKIVSLAHCTVIVVK